jgi:hypothetical protein
MRADAREVGRRSAVVALVMLVVLAGCPAVEPELGVVERIPVPAEGVETLHAAASGDLWGGAPGEFIVLARGEAALRVALSSAHTPRVVAERDGRLFVSLGPDSLLSVETGPGDSITTAASAGIPYLDVRGRVVFFGAASGAVLLHDISTLSRISAWPSLDAPTTALTGTAEGDRIYQAIEEGGGGVILTRDLQTGRILRTNHFPAPFHQLEVDRAGNLVGLIGGGSAAGLVSLRPRGDELELRWRERLAGTADETSFRISPDGARIALVTQGVTKSGLRVLNTETGNPLGRVDEPPRDAAFDASGRLLLLYPGEIRVVGGPDQ